MAAALLALFPGQIFFSTLVMTEVLFAALLTLITLLVVLWTLPPRADPPGQAAGRPPSAEGNERPAAYKLLLLGLLLGYGAITRGEGGVVVLAVLIIWWLARSGWRPFLRCSALLLAGVVLVMAPWTIRNFVVFHAPVFVSTAMGSALWQGNGPDVYTPGHLGFDTKFYNEYADVPYPRKEVEMNNAAMREAVDFIVHNPGTEAGLLFKKIYHLYQEDAVGLAWIDEHGGQPSIPDPLQQKLETVANAYYFVVLGWVALTVPFWFSFRDRSRFLLPLMIAVLTAAHLVFIPQSRYHFAFIPILCVMAAPGIVAVWRRLTARLRQPGRWTERAGIMKGLAFAAALGQPVRRLSATAARCARGRQTLAALFLLALVLRLAWIACVDPSPRDGRFDDSSWYDGSAQNIAGGQGYIFFDRAPTAAWPVGYPAFVAAIYRVTDDSVLSAKVANAFLGALTVLGVYALGALVFGSRAGWAAALVLAFFPSQVFFTTLVMSEILTAALLLLVLLAVVYLTLNRERARWWGAAAVGLLIGLTAMVRGEFLLFFLVPLLPWRLVLGSWRRALGYLGVSFVAMALVLTPWTVRNAVRLGYPVVVSTGAAANLLAGHWSGADGAGTFIPGNSIQEQYLYLSNPEREVVMYRAHIRKAIAWAVRHPWEEITLVPRKVYHLYRSDSSAVQWIQTRPVMNQEQADWWTDLSNGCYYVVGGWVLLSIPAWWCLRDPRRLLLMLTVLYFSLIFGVVFVGDPRYHFALVPAAVVLASPALVVVWEHMRRREEAPVEEAGRPPPGPDVPLTEGLP